MSGSQPQVLYTPEQRARRDATRWTLVQGILAPVQFLVFLISLYLVITSLQSGENTDSALVSVGETVTRRYPAPPSVVPLTYP